MANSISSYVKQILTKSPFINEMLLKEVINYANLAYYIQPQVEKLYGKDVNHSSIVMAIRRYSDDMKEVRSKEEEKIDIQYNINIKTNIYDVNFVHSDSFFSSLPMLYEKVQITKGDFLNISMGSHEISLAVSEKFKPIVDEILKDEEVLNTIDKLVSITISFSSGYLQTPGILYLASKKLAWENINLIEIVTTMNELTFIVEAKDSMKAFEVLQSLFNEEI